MSALGATSYKRTLNELISNVQPPKKNLLIPAHQYDCVTLESTYNAGRTIEQSAWCQLAYDGDWIGLIKFILEHRTTYINSTRLRKESNPNPPSGYTALHQVAYHGAPLEVAKLLVGLGALRWARTTDGKNQRPLDIAQQENHQHLYEILTPPNLVPNLSDENLKAIQDNFHQIILQISGDDFEKQSLRLPDLSMFREREGNVWMAVPGMYGGFKFSLDNDGVLTSESSCRIMGGSGMRYHITPNETKLVAQGFV